MTSEQIIGIAGSDAVATVNQFNLPEDPKKALGIVLQSDNSFIQMMFDSYSSESRTPELINQLQQTLDEKKELGQSAVLQYKMEQTIQVLELPKDEDLKSVLAFVASANSLVIANRVNRQSEVSFDSGEFRYSAVISKQANTDGRGNKFENSYQELFTKEQLANAPQVSVVENVNRDLAWMVEIDNFDSSLDEGQIAELSSILVSSIVYHLKEATDNQIMQDIVSDIKKDIAIKDTFNGADITNMRVIVKAVRDLI